MSRLAVLGTFALVLSAFAAPSSAAAQVRIGMLHCQGAGTIGYVVGSVESLRCTFQPSRGKPYLYRGVVHRFGLDLGFTGQSSVAWLVFASTRRVGHANLAGIYGGVSAAATVGIGIGANALVGGSGNSVTLQPLSVQGQTGLSVAGGLSQLELIPERRPHRRKHRRSRR
jgi:hypothetical protein